MGFIFAFISAMIAVRALIRYVSHHDFTIFAWYRIAFGVIAVSYTHLDVYKRQPFDGMWCATT